MHSRECELRTSAVNANARHSRKTRSQALYRRFSVATVKKLIFTDEKDFTLEVPTNRQNDRVYARGRKSDICPNILYHHRNRFSNKLMVSAGVSWNGKTEFFFIDPRKTKVNQKTYIDFLKTSLLPECRRLYPEFQTMISSSCKTALHHTAPKQLKIFFESTRLISVRKAILQWKRRLAAVAKQNGGPIQHIFC